MPHRYEAPPAITAAEAHQLLESGDVRWDDIPPVILGVALHEPQRLATEGFCTRYVGATHEDCNRAGLLGLAHFRASIPVLHAEDLGTRTGSEERRGAVVNVV